MSCAHHRGRFLSACAIGGLALVSSTSPSDPELTEVSGVALRKGALCLVGDNKRSRQAWFELTEWPNEPGQHRLDLTQARAVPFDAKNERAYQLEDVAVLGERVLVISEAEGRILDRRGTLVELPDAMKEVEREGQDVGPEGLAAREHGNAWRLVAVNQGWRTEPVKILEHRLSEAALAERWRTELRDARPLELTQAVLREHFNAYFERHAAGGRIDPAQGHFVRVPAIEWIRLGPSSDDWGYLVVMAVRRDRWHPWLQRVATDGALVGDPLDLLKHGASRLNWEGLAWVGEQRVLLVDDNGGDGPSHALVVDLPPEWFPQASSAAPTQAAFDVSELSGRTAAESRSWFGLLERPSLQCGIYRLPAGATDGQSPHDLDEIYYVIDGVAWLEAGGERLRAKPGAVLFVERGTEHRFVEIEADLTLLVVFAGGG